MVPKNLVRSQLIMWGLRLAIVLDNKIISAPVIREAITGGSGTISGNFTFQEVTDLALLLRSGLYLLQSI